MIFIYFMIFITFDSIGSVVSGHIWIAVGVLLVKWFVSIWLACERRMVLSSIDNMTVMTGGRYVIWVDSLSVEWNTSEWSSIPCGCVCVCVCVCVVHSHVEWLTSKSRCRFMHKSNTRTHTIIVMTMPFFRISNVPPPKTYAYAAYFYALSVNILL